MLYIFLLLGTGIYLVLCYISVYIPFAEIISLPAYRSVRNKLLTSVDFPKPDSPVKPETFCHIHFKYKNMSVRLKFY